MNLATKPTQRVCRDIASRSQLRSQHCESEQVVVSDACQVWVHCVAVRHVGDLSRIAHVASRMSSPLLVLTACSKVLTNHLRRAENTIAEQNSRTFSPGRLPRRFSGKEQLCPFSKTLSIAPSLRFISWILNDQVCVRIAC